ncbi:MAG: 6-pyruvoyl-tetrahydropterin synthase-related protein, partial [Caldilinea sp.]
MQYSSYRPAGDQHPQKDRRRCVLTGLALGTAMLVLALPALWPFIRLGLTLSADGMLHVLRTAMLATYQQEGMFYPRWMPDLVLGYGYPLLSFYGPATYYLASLFVFFGADPALALLLTFAAMLLLAGAGIYLLVYDLAGEADGWKRHSAAMVGAVAYLYAPYLLINIYARGAVAEVGAQMLLPWILWFLRRIFYAANPAPYALGFAFSAALLALTHNISLLFMPPAIVVYGLAVIWQAQRLPWPLKSRAGVAILAGAAALGISAFFWLPLLLERGNLADTAFAIAARYVSENTWTLSNFLDLSLPYEYSTAIPFQLGAVQVLLALVGFVVLPRRSAEWWALLAILLGACLLISAWALPLWLNSQILLIAQFPWRLLAVASLPLAVFPAGIILRVRQRWAALIVALALIGIIILSQRPSVESFTPLLDQSVLIGRPATAQFEFQTNAFGTSSSSEFLPRWAGQNLFGVAEETGAGAPVPAIRLEIGTSVAMEAVITTTAPIDLNVTNFYFPGWSATIDGQPAELRPDPERGMQTLTAPAGVHRIVISGLGTPLQQATTWVSLVTLAALAVGVWLTGAQRRWLAAAPALFLLVGVFATLEPP